MVRGSRRGPPPRPFHPLTRLTYPGFMKTRPKCTSAFKSTHKTSLTKSCKNSEYLTSHVHTLVGQILVSSLSARLTFSPIETPPDVTTTSTFSKAFCSCFNRGVVLKHEIRLITLRKRERTQGANVAKNESHESLAMPRSNTLYPCCCTADTRVILLLSLIFPTSSSRSGSNNCNTSFQILIFFCKEHRSQAMYGGHIWGDAPRSLCSSRQW